MKKIPLRETEKPFPAADLPEVIVEAEPGFAEFYRLAWKLAWDHVCEMDQRTYLPRHHGDSTEASLE